MHLNGIALLLEDYCLRIYAALSLDHYSYYKSSFLAFMIQYDRKICLF